jgi:hypothetical protein
VTLRKLCVIFYHSLVSNFPAPQIGIAISHRANDVQNNITLLGVFFLLWVSGPEIEREYVMELRQVFILK